MERGWRVGIIVSGEVRREKRADGLGFRVLVRISERGCAFGVWSLGGGGVWGAFSELWKTYFK